MKKIWGIGSVIFLIVTLLNTAPIVAQKQKTDSWEIFHNRKEVATFKYSDDNDERKIVLLNRSLDEPGFFIITYKPVPDQEEWNRNFVITDSNGRDLKKFENTTQFKVHNSEIARLMESRPKLKIYTWALPKDPEKAAAIRVRRILLCTIYTR